MKQLIDDGDLSQNVEHPIVCCSCALWNGETAHQSADTALVARELDEHTVVDFQHMAFGNYEIPSAPANRSLAITAFANAEAFARGL